MSWLGRRLRFGILCLAVMGCGPDPASQAQEPGTSGPTPRERKKRRRSRTEPMGFTSAQRIHPDVVEFVLCQPDSPLVGYYETALGDDVRPELLESLAETQGDLPADQRSDPRALACARAKTLASNYRGMSTHTPGQLWVSCCRGAGLPGPSRPEYDRYNKRGPASEVAARLYFLQSDAADVVYFEWAEYGRIVRQAYAFSNDVLDTPWSEQIPNELLEKNARALHRAR